MITTEPWHIDPAIYRTLPQKGGSTYTLVPAGKSDFQKVNDLYQKSPVKGYCISQLQIVHNPLMTRQFEGKVMMLDARATSPAFRPKWNTESEVSLRTRIDQSLKTVALHSPISRNVLFFPAFHGTKAPLLDSIFQTGFANLATTDSGFFGKGIYNTTHASYAHRVYSDGALLFNWVAFFSAYPVTLPDMAKLQGGANYSNYDAHYALVYPKNPANPHEIVYLPITSTQTPTYDELAVFDSSQVFPRYLVTLSPEGLNLTPLTPSVTGVTLMRALGACLADAPLSILPFLVQQIGLLATHLDSPLTPNELVLFTTLERTKEETDPAIKLTLFSRITKLIDMAPSPGAAPHMQAVAPQIILPSSQPTLPPQAFGKAQWEKYFGNIGAEPPLPPNIHQILQGPCPLWPDKKVQDTHMLVLIPTNVNGQPLTLKTLGELIQKPKQGPATKFHGLNLADYQDEPVPSSYWVLMSRDVVRGSRNQRYDKQKPLVAEIAQKHHVPYTLPKVLEAAICILVTHVSTGQKLYSDNPHTYTRCQEVYESVCVYPFSVGGFSPRGLSITPSNPFEHDYHGFSALRKF